MTSSAVAVFYDGVMWSLVAKKLNRSKVQLPVKSVFVYLFTLVCFEDLTTGQPLKKSTFLPQGWISCVNPALLFQNIALE